MINLKIIPKDFNVLVSSGVDSIAAAHILKFMFRRNFTVYHFNHNLRPQNNVMEEGVSKFCNKFDIPLVVCKLETDGTEGEGELREKRLKVMDQNGGHFVTAHHLDDAVENYIMNVAKGCPEFTPIKEVSQKIIHPFLRRTKDFFSKYIVDNKLEEFIVEDETNTDTKYLRNKIRHEVIPLFDWTNLRKVVLKKFYM